jgi:hypothetical protein
LESEKQRELESAHSIELRLNLPSSEYSKLEQKYRKQAEEIEEQIHNLTKPIAPNFSKSDRLIENLKHQRIQLKSNIKFQRAALDSEWKLKMDSENSRFEEFSMEFGEKFNRFQQLFDSKVALNEFREKSAEEIVKLEREMINLKYQNEEIHAAVTAEREKGNCADHLKVLYDTARNDADRLLTDAKAQTQTEIANLHELILDIQTHIETEKQPIVCAIEGLGLDEIANELIAGRDGRLRKLAEEAKKYLIELEKQKQTIHWEFETRARQLTEQMKNQMLQNKEEKFRHFTEYNMNLSQRNLALEDFSKDNRTIITSLKEQKRAVLDFWNEKVEVAINTRNAKKIAFLEQGPRAEEQIAIEGMQGLVRMVISKQNEMGSSLTEVKKAIVRQEKSFNRRFGKRPKVGVVRSYRSAVV